MHFSYDLLAASKHWPHDVVIIAWRANCHIVNAAGSHWLPRLESSLRLSRTPT